MTKAKLIAALAPACLLTGCLSLGEDPPQSLLTLSPTTAAPAGTGATGTDLTAIALVEFVAPRKIDVTRVPVQVTDSQIAYVKEAVWVEKPARLFRRLIAETLRARTGRVVIDGDDPEVMADDRLTGTVREFGFDARTSEAVVVFDAVRTGEGSEVTTRRFEARVPGVVAEAGPVGAALNQAANDVAGQVVDWLTDSA